MFQKEKKDVEKLEPEYIAGGNIEWYCCYGNQLNIEFPYDSLSSLGMHPTELKTELQSLHMKSHSSSIHNIQKVETTRYPPTKNT